MPSEIIQWFPGHMAKTRRMIGENLKLVDLTIELLDARIPISSRNPEIVKLTKDKPRLTLLSRSSLADEAVTAEWKRYFTEDGDGCIFYDYKTGAGISDIMPAVRTLCEEKLRRYSERGMEGRKLRAMILGIPNVGKSSLINKLAGDKKAKVENRPGVTREKQWVPTSLGIDLLDTPGVLWPKFDEKTAGENLALTGAIKDDVLDIETLSFILCRRLRKLYPELLKNRYKLEDADLSLDLEDWRIAERIGFKRGFLQKGGEVNLERTAKTLLDEFRVGLIGRITLERPPKK